VFLLYLFKFWLGPDSNFFYNLKANGSCFLSSNFGLVIVLILLLLRVFVSVIYFLCGGEERRISHRHGLGFSYKKSFISAKNYFWLFQRQDFGFYYSAVLAFTIQILAFTIQKGILSVYLR
jgi:hypothetical protein